MTNVAANYILTSSNSIKCEASNLEGVFIYSIYTPSQPMARIWTKSIL